MTGMIGEKMNTFYKVIVLDIDLFESSISNELHFGTKEEAATYISQLNQNQIGVMIEL